MENVKFVNFQFVDILGITREKLVPVTIYQRYLESGLYFDGSSIFGYTDVKCSDLKLVADKNYIYNLPQNKKIIFCQAEHGSDSRKALKNVIKKYSDMGIEAKIGAELEFFIFDKSPEGVIINNLENKGYLGSLSRKLTKFFERVLVILESLKFNVECVHHECAPNQYELDFKFDSPLEIADKVTIIKGILKDVAEKSSLYVSFMPKPFSDKAGSGMHINISLYKGGNNLFSDDITDTQNNFINGIFAHIGGITAFANSLINSYKRLGKNESPDKVYCSRVDRRALIRIPLSSKQNSRIELRSPDNCCNPYTTFAAILYAGMDGIINKIKTIPKTSVPISLSESLKRLKRDKCLCGYMGEVVNSYIGVKQKECEEFYSYITDWEIKKYL